MINNNSTDNTSEICKEFAEANPELIFRHVIESNVGFSFVRNRAITEAQFELMSFVDDDETVLPNYADAILQAFSEYPEYTVLGGKIIPVFEDNKEPKFLSKFMNPFTKVDFGDKEKEYPTKLSFKNPTIHFAPGGNIVFCKEVFERCGNYDSIEGYGEDAYMFEKLKTNNEKVLYCPAVVIFHHIAKERCQYNSLMNQAYRGGKGNAIRLKDKKQKRLFNRIAKFLATIAIGVFYSVTLRPIKAKYLISYNYNTLKGYIENL